MMLCHNFYLLTYLLITLSRDQNSFFARNSPAKRFNPTSWGDSELAFKNTPIKISFIPLGPFHEKFFNLGERFS